MSGQEVAGIGTALAAAILALLPVYQKFREIRRSEAVADHETGVDRLGRDVRTAFSAAFQHRDSVIIMTLSLLILGGLIHNAWRATHYSAIIDSHYSEFIKIRDLVNQRYGEEKAQRAEMLETLHRIEAAIHRMKP